MRLYKGLPQSKTRSGTNLGYLAKKQEYFVLDYVQSRFD